MTPPKTAAEIREAFTQFYVERGHTAAPHARLVPVDPTVMFTIAGMVQFKDYFTGREAPPFRRATTIQPCVRTVDIDIIGTTARHLTFFEMLGHFSFGDYFKPEAIPWAWEFYTTRLGIDPGSLWITVHDTDDEAEKIWVESVGVPASRVQRMGEDNFWKMGETGPCGPCSELYFDKGERWGAGGGPALGNPERYVEIGNLVFMQYEKKVAGGELVALPAPSVDFGGGLERLLPILQGTDSVFDTDVIAPTMRVAEEVTGRTRTESTGGVEVALRVMADHARAIAFVASEGVVPSNEGRGFVLRRLVRRVVLKAAQLGREEPLMGELIGSVVDTMGTAYPHIRAKAGVVKDAIANEEESFRRTLSTGLALLEDRLAEYSGGTLPGDVAFLLHDTHGFPIDLTREISSERGVEVDMEGFEVAMAGQRQRARQAVKGTRQASGSEASYRELVERVGATRFRGYQQAETQSEIVEVAVPAVSPEVTGTGAPVPSGRLVEVFLAETPFYAESGGQVGDTGTITTASGTAEVVDTTYALPGLVRHLAVVSEGDLLAGEVATAHIDSSRRDEVRRNHTGTHLLHWALRQVLGEHVHQQGSLVAPDRLRFDFSHFASVSEEELARVEDLVNGSVLTDEAVQVTELPKEEALARGAMAFFGDKYGDTVRVVEAGRSLELCGGTHVAALGMIGPLKVVSEGSVGSGIRRVEAVTGSVSFRYVRDVEERLERASRALKVSPAELPDALERLLARLKAADEEMKVMRSAARTEVARVMASGAEGGVIVVRRDGGSPDELRELAMEVRNHTGIRAVVLGGSPDGTRVSLVAAVPKGSTVVASELIADAAKTVGGGAGRGQEVAVAGGREVSRIDEALDIVRRRVSEALGR